MVVDRRRVAAGHDRIAEDQPVHAERPAIEIHALGQAERRVELAIEGRIPARVFDAERLQQPVDGLAEQRLGRLQRLGPAVTDQQPFADAEFVAFGVSSEIVVILEDQDAGLGTVRLAIKPRRRQAADAAADHDEIESLLDREAGDVIRLALATDLMGDLEGSGMAAAQAGQCRRIVAARPGAQLGERSQTAGDDQCGTVEKVAAADGIGHVFSRLLEADSRGRLTS